jgi:hypothetical protein
MLAGAYVPVRATQGRHFKGSEPEKGFFSTVPPVSGFGEDSITSRCKNNDYTKL